MSKKHEISYAEYVKTRWNLGEEAKNKLRRVDGKTNHIDDRDPNITICTISGKKKNICDCMPLVYFLEKERTIA